MPVCSQIILNVLNGGRLRMPPREALPGEPLEESDYAAFTDLIRRCWEQQPEDRPTLDAVCSELRALVARRLAGNSSGALASPA